MNVGMIAGSFIGALTSRSFKLRRPVELQGYLLAIGGGVLMGYGAGLASGCTIGSLFSAVPSLGLNGFIFGIALAAGAFLGLRITQRLAN